MDGLETVGTGAAVAETPVEGAEPTTGEGTGTEGGQPTEGEGVGEGERTEGEPSKGEGEGEGESTAEDEGEPEAGGDGRTIDLKTRQAIAALKKVNPQAAKVVAE